MSGSSYAEHRFTRISVGLNSGISISWAPDPDGGYAHGQQHHQREEHGYFERLRQGAAQIEVLCDALEAAGRVFTVPDDPRFANAQRIESSAKFPICSVRVLCAPPLSDDELKALLEKVEAAIAEAPPVPQPAPPPAAELPPPAPKPWWKLW